MALVTNPNAEVRPRPALDRGEGLPRDGHLVGPLVPSHRRLARQQVEHRRGLAARAIAPRTDGCSVAVLLIRPHTLNEVARVLAHLSDLHLGRGGAAAEHRAWALREALWRRAVDHVVVTGDLTHRGQRHELARFEEIFAPFIESGRLSVVPGNHDRLGEDVSAALRGGARVQVEQPPGLHLVRVDTTGPHNRSLIAGHGLLTAEDLAAIDRAFDGVPAGRLAVLALHHHLFQLPHDNGIERLVSLLGWSSGRELERGAELALALRGRCQLVLHGHRHEPGLAALFTDDARPLLVSNAGSSTELLGFRLFRHEAGRLAGAPRWSAGAPPPIGRAPRIAPSPAPRAARAGGRG